MTYTFTMRSLKKTLLLLAVFLLTTNLIFAADSEKAEQQRQALIKQAKEYIGAPYVTGGTDRSGFDCSGLVFTCGKEALNMDLPRTAAALYDYVKIVADSKKEAGDLLFFKTVGDKISHVAIYIGNDQFIHAASDGPNTGVIISSLHESYWSKTYFAVGQLLPSTISAKTADAGQGTTDSDTAVASGKKPSSGGASDTSTKTRVTFNGFLSALTYNASACLNWSFLSSQGFKLNIRGATFDFCAIYPDANLKPGLALKVRWDPTIHVVQLPLVLSLSTSDNLRFYAGPVISIGTPVLDGTEEEIQASVFPGILGFSWQTNAFEMFGLETRLVQDISYTVFNNSQGAALGLLNSFATGLYMTTGLRVTIPL